MKYVFVSGGVISGIGKGTVSSSVGALLRSRGHVITYLKIDPYLNYNAGPIHPYEHGETYVLDDGHECDMDFGNYERFNMVCLSRRNSITSGRLFSELIGSEREGAFLGKTLQMNPHVIDEIIRRIVAVSETGVSEFGDSGSSSRMPEVVIVELGGTIGEYESLVYTEAFSKFQQQVGRENCVFISVDYVIELASGEQKTKPIQIGCKNFRSFGLQHDIIVCRAQRPLTQESRRKLSANCWVREENIFNLPNLSSVYEAPGFLEKQGMVSSLNRLLQLSDKGVRLETLRMFERLARRNGSRVRIGIVAKYSSMFDSYVSLVHALNFSGVSVGVDVEILWIDAESLEETGADGKLCGVDGIIIPGGFGVRGVEGKIKAIQYGREKMVPLLGICLGYQLSIVEMCRNMLGIENATSEEFGGCGEQVVIKFITDEKGVADRKLRVGGFGVELVRDGVVKQLYGNRDRVRERHRHRFEVARERIGELEDHGLHFVGMSTDRSITKIFELEKHPFFVGVQFHPEFMARPNHPHPLITGFLSSAHKNSKQ